MAETVQLGSGSADQPGPEGVRPMNFPVGDGKAVDVTLDHHGIWLQVTADRSSKGLEITGPDIAKQIAVELFYLARQMRKLAAPPPPNRGTR